MEPDPGDALAGRRYPEDFIPGEALPSPMIGGPGALSESARRELKRLSGPRPARFLIELGLVWLTVISAISLAVYADNLLASALAICLVATRQNLLGLLVHEQVHYLCSRRRWADVVTNLFAAWPLIGLTVENYAGIHLAHHSYFFTEKDPDFFRKNGVEWTFPMRVRFLFWLFFRDLIGGSFLAFVSGKRSSRQPSVKRPPPLPAWVRVAYYLGIASASVRLGAWEVILVFWILPLVTVFPAIVRFGAICEHKYNVASGKLEESTAIIIPRWWERLILPNLNFTYHIYHHYHPGVSFSSLPKVHDLYRREALVDESNVFVGYTSYLRQLMECHRRAAGARSGTPTQV